MDDAKISALMIQCNGGEITLQELRQKLADGGSDLKVYDKRSERNVNYPDGNNESRNGFIFNPGFHPKGQFFQNVIKKAILAAINFAHSAIVKNYDREAYLYDDSRLRDLNIFLRKYIDANFQDSKPYKSDFMLKLVDILLFLMKEDVYYRARMIDIFANMPRSELTDIEKENIEKWH